MGKPHWIFTMAVTQYDKSELITKLKGFKVVSTESGPIVPAKDKLIKAMTKGVMEPIGNQISEEWDRRIYSERNPFFDNKTRKNVKDIMQEAAEQTADKGIRLNLESIDAEKSRCLLRVSRRGKMFTVDILYPNTKGDISVIVTNENGEIKKLELGIESEDYVKNFGNRILETIDAFAAEDAPANMDDLLYNDLDTVLPENTPAEPGLNPETRMVESVGWQLGRDMRETRRILMEQQEVGPNGFGPEDFAAAPEGDDPNQVVADAEQANEQMTDPTAGGVQANDPTYTEFATENASILKNGTTDHMAEIIASSAEETPVILGMDKQLNGFAGIKDMKDQEIINAFGKLFGFIKNDMTTDPSRPVPESETDVRLPKEKWEAVFTALEDEYTTPDHFKEQLGKILPDMFDSQGSMHNPDAEMTALQLPNDPYDDTTVKPGDEFSVATPAPEGPAAGATDSGVFGSLAEDNALAQEQFLPDESEDTTSRYDQIFQNVV